MEESPVPVLFLAMEFAPINTTGNFRSLKFVKYLAQFNVQPIVVTLKEDEGVKYFRTSLDNSLLDEIPKGTVIYRIHCDDDSSYYNSKLRSFFTIYFSIKDTFARRWKRHVFAELKEIILKHQPKLIYTSLPPFSSGLLAVEIADQYHLPLVVDMRDLYSMWGNTPFGSIFHYWLTKAEERRIFSKASAVLAVTPQLLEIFKTSHPQIDEAKFHLLSNGYDLQEALQETFVFSAAKKKIVIGYVGSFYYYPEAREQIFKPWWKKRGHKMLTYSPTKEDWLYRSPYFFLKTMAQLFKIHPVFREIISIEFVGTVPDWLLNMIKDFNLQDQVKLHGFVTHQNAKSLQQNFDLLLATSEKVFQGQHYSLPSKIFDYIGQGKPILGFVTEGIQREFLVKSGLGVVCDPDQVDESVEVIINLIRNGKIFRLDRNYLSLFHRRKLTEHLSDIIKSAIKTFK